MNNEVVIFEISVVRVVSVRKRDGLVTKSHLERRLQPALDFVKQAPTCPQVNNKKNFTSMSNSCDF
jgi:hypothetical protein